MEVRFFGKNHNDEEADDEDGIWVREGRKEGGRALSQAELEPGAHSYIES